MVPKLEIADGDRAITERPKPIDGVVMSDSRFPDLATERLLLEPFAHRHSGGVFALWSSPEVCRYSGEAQDWDGRRIELPARTVVDSDKIIDFFIRRAAEGTGVRWAVILQKSDRCIGAVGLNALTPLAELAYHLHPIHWGSGYAKEACTAVIRWCRESLRGVSIEAFIETENVASARLAKRLGFEESPTSREGAQRYVLISDSSSVAASSTA